MASKPLYEKCRPKSWAEVVGQDTALRAIMILRERGLGGRAFWISGPSGVGKTTIARLLTRELADEFFVTEIDANQLNTPCLRQLRETMWLGAWGKGGRALIVNEAHGLRADVVRELLVWLEELPGHVMVVFTTTNAGEAMLFGRLADFNPLLSRCIDLRLNREPAGIAGHVKRIAAEEGLDGAPLEAYERLADECDHNVRMMLNAIEAGRMLNDVTVGGLLDDDDEGKDEHKDENQERVIHV